MRAGWMAVVLLAGALAAEAVAPVVTVRARVTEMEPESYVRIHWSWGGMGLGGDPVSGEWTSVKPKAPSAPAATGGDLDLLGGDKDEDLLGHLKAPEKNPDIMIENGGTFDYYWLKKGVWSPPLPFSAFRSPNMTFLTVFADACVSGDPKKPVRLTKSVFEFEVLVDGKPVKTITEDNRHGNVVGILLPLKALVDGKATPEALARIRSLSAYSKWKGDYMEGLPWAGDPLPEQFEMVTDCSGYGTHFGYKVRTGNEQVFLDEFRVLRQMGVNGLRGRPGFFADWVAAGDPRVRPFLKVRIGACGGYPYREAPRSAETGKLHAPPWEPGVGCPHHPVYSNRVDEIRREVAEVVAESRTMDVKSAWLLTQDEIGSAYGGTAEGGNHIGICPYCIETFRSYLKAKGLAPKDFDAESWEPVRPVSGYFSRSYEQEFREAKEAAAKAAPKVDQTVIDFGGKPLTAGSGEKGAVDVAPAPAGPVAPKADLDDTVVDKGDEKDPEPNPELDAILGLDAPMAQVAGAEKPKIPPPGLTVRGWHKLTYWTLRFKNDSSAMLFTPKRDAFAAANAAKRKALEAGKTDSPEALQSWFFMYALRGNTYLMGGGSLDFFDFYRYADTGFMYETSNRDPRVWPWDSYLCDVGRTLKEKMGLAFGIYVKPHRGAPIQRALTAAARGARCIYWYTYGPEWWKGDTFGGNTNVLADVSEAARLIGAAEPVTWEGRWAKPVDVAVVRPRTSEFFGNTAQWEDGKWVYSALQHAHLPVDAIDEEFLMTEDLSRYKVIYVTGSHMRREVAARLEQYVKNGGALFTGCGGLAKDEAGEPLDMLLPVFGLKERSSPVLWGGVRRYGATGLPGIAVITNAPADAVVSAKAGAPFNLRVGYEKLDALKETEVRATFGDGTAALTRHAYGKGTAWMAGFYPGMEYAAGVMKSPYDTAVDFQGGKRAMIAAAALEAGARPAVDASEPMIEGVWVENAKSGRQAVLLMNWAYRGRVPVVFSNVTVRLAGAAAVGKVHSAGQRRDLPVAPQGKDLLVKLGDMREGDVLLLQ